MFKDARVYGVVRFEATLTSSETYPAIVPVSRDARTVFSTDATKRFGPTARLEWFLTRKARNKAFKMSTTLQPCGSPRHHRRA
jgi:hypothetical protein